MRAGIHKKLADDSEATLRPFFVAEVLGRLADPRTKVPMFERSLFSRAGFCNEASWNQLGNALDIIAWPMLSHWPGVVCGIAVGPRATTVISQGKGTSNVA